MAALTAVVTALSIAVAANFLLLLAVMRRLRTQRPVSRSIQESLPKVGMQAPTFNAQDAEARPIDEGFYSAGSEVVVAFFTDGCEPCDLAKEELASDPILDPLLAFVRTREPGPGHAEFAATLARTGGRMVTVEPASDIPARFSAGVFPTFMRLRDGVVVVSSVKLADVRGQRDARSAAAGRRRFVRRAPAERAEAGELVNR